LGRHNPILARHCFQTVRLFDRDHYALEEPQKAYEKLSHSFGARRPQVNHGFMGIALYNNEIFVTKGG
jgi:hypothetical protein